MIQGYFVEFSKLKKPLQNFMHLLQSKVSLSAILKLTIIPNLAFIFVLFRRVTALTGFGASSLLDTSLYQMVLLEDAHTIEKAHKICMH